MMLNQHSLKMGLNFAAAQLKLFDNVGYFLKSMNITMGHTSGMCYHKKCGAFKKNNFISPAKTTKLVQM